MVGYVVAGKVNQSPFLSQQSLKKLYQLAKLLLFKPFKFN